MSRIGSSLLLHGRILPVDDVIGRIESVSLDDVHGVARDIAVGTRTVSTVGPVELAGIR
jgi:predicted Zn-dependent peptidase